jgi:hypothetical protein
MSSSPEANTSPSDSDEYQKRSRTAAALDSTEIGTAASAGSATAASALVVTQLECASSQDVDQDHQKTASKKIRDPKTANLTLHLSFSHARFRFEKNLVVPTPIPRVAEKQKVAWARLGWFHYVADLW